MYNDYMNSVLALAKSLVIKNNYYAKAIEDSIISKKIQVGLEIEVPQTQWKYYLNLSGEYHPTDEVMTVVSLDTLEEIVFTKENLEIHRSTKKGYLTETRYVKELLERYPNNHLLVKSILNPVDINHALKSANYTILQYDENLIEAQEFGLIQDIQDRIDIFVQNWFNKEFTFFDSEYFQEFYKQLIFALPLFIQQVRETNEFTYKVHSYFLWSYLETKAGLYEYKEFLNFSQANWLYRNINYVLNNLGKQMVFDDLIRVLLTDKNIPIGRYEIDHLTKGMDQGEDYTPKAIVKKIPLNLLKFTGDEARDSSVNALMKKQLTLARSNKDDFSTAVADTEEKLKRFIQSPVKVYETDVIANSGNSVYSLPETMIYHWAYYSHLDIYQSRFFIRNAKNGSVMPMDAKDAFVLYSYLLAKKAGIDMQTFPVIELYDTINPAFDPDKDVGYFKDLVSPEYISLFNDNYPKVGTYISSQSFREACVGFHQFLVSMDNALGFPEALDMRYDYADYMQRRLINGQIRIAPDGYSDVETWLVNKEWDVMDLDDASIEVTLLEIEEKVLAVDSSVIDTATVQKKMTKLLGDLSSYNIQIVTSGNLEDVKLNKTPVPEIGKYVLKNTLMVDVTLNEADNRSSMKRSFNRATNIGALDFSVGVESHLNFVQDLELDVRSVRTVSTASYVDIW